MNKNLGKNVIIKIISVKGKCDYVHKPGQEFQHSFTGLCPYALHTLWPYITAKKFGGKVPWEKGGKLRISCPNPSDLVIFELSVK